MGRDAVADAVECFLPVVRYMRARQRQRSSSSIGRSSIIKQAYASMEATLSGGAGGFFLNFFFTSYHSFLLLHFQKAPRASWPETDRSLHLLFMLLAALRLVLSRGSHCIRPMAPLLSRWGGSPGPGPGCPGTGLAALQVLWTGRPVCQ